ncbi:hypothetical protein H4R35_005686, partial [Dimargaris xerosporica]
HIFIDSIAASIKSTARVSLPLFNFSAPIRARVLNIMTKGNPGRWTIPACVGRFRVILVIIAVLFVLHVCFSTLWQTSGDSRPAQSMVLSKPNDMNVPPVQAPGAAAEGRVSSPEVSTGASNPASFTEPNPTLVDINPEDMPAPAPNVTKVKGVFVVLVRNKELHDLRWSLRQLEDRFNHKYNYPYVFLNDRPFTKEFKETVSWITNSTIHFGQVPKEHWSLPEYIDRYKMLEGMNKLTKQHVIYGSSVSYRHMCRFNSGFFFQHPLLDGYEYYWRVEPDVQFTCDINYDPFVYMKEHRLKYGFTISLKEIPQTVATLWDSTKGFMEKYPEYVAQPNTLDWVSNDGGKTYNMCHFWSNFEIGDLSFFRSERYLKYFEYLDHEGGFFYERWGDAPVHSIAVAMFLKKEEVHWFEDIGYVHTVAQNCPSDKEVQKNCHCNPRKSADRKKFSCTRQWMALPDNVVT